MAMFKTIENKDNKNKFGNKKLPIKFDIRTLNMIIGFLFKNSVQVNLKSLKNCKALFDVIDTDIYASSDNLYTRVNFVKSVLEARIDRKFENEEAIINYAMSDNPTEELQNIINSIPSYKKLNYEEIKYVNRLIEDRLTYSYMLEYKDIMYSTIERLDSGDFRTYQEINDDFSSLCTKFITQARKIKNVNTLKTLTLSDEAFVDNIMGIVTELKNPSKCYSTGIQCLNKMLSPGYLSKRLYTYLGAPAGFKSGILLKSAIDIKKYNRHIPNDKPGKRRAVLFVTMENSIEETVERLFNMTLVADDIRNYTPKQVLKMLREDGSFVINDRGDDTDIDIVLKYFDNREIDTGDLYSIIEEMNDNNQECIALVLDYMKRIRARERGRDEKEELKNISNELKALANEYDIPVITATQINREGARTLDAAMQDNKTDVGKFVGRSNVGSAWEIIENTDVCIFINVEKKVDTDKYYLTFKRVKIRYRDGYEMSYFNHPFVEGNRMKLVDDIHLDKPLSEASLTSDFEGVAEFTKQKKGKKGAREREIVDNTPEDARMAESFFNFDRMVS